MPPARNVRRYGKQQPLKQNLNGSFTKRSNLSTAEQTNPASNEENRHALHDHAKSSTSPLLTLSQPLNAVVLCDETKNNNFRCDQQSLSEISVAGGDISKKLENYSYFPDGGKETVSGCETTPSTCVACHETIFDRFIVRTGATGRPFHETCLRCSMCNILLSNEQTCFVKDDVIYCKRDYMGLFATCCAKCHRSISTNDWVRRARDRVYHLACFACDACKRQLSNGEEYTLIYTDSLLNISARNNNLSTTIANNTHILHNHSKPAHNTIRAGEDTTRLNLLCVRTNNANDGNSRPPSTSLDGSVASSSSSAEEEENSSFISSSSSCPPTPRNDARLSTSNEKVLLQRPRFDNSIVKRLRADPTTSATEQQDTTAMTVPDAKLLCKAHYLELVEGPKANGSKPKTKRMRTTFTDEQIHILQTHFNVDSNPDGQDLERIALQTGNIQRLFLQQISLSKRVTQVWFQNSRARQKKSLQKRLHRQTATLGSLSSSLQHHHRQQQSSSQFGNLLISSSVLQNTVAPSEISPSLVDGADLRRSPSNCSSTRIHLAPDFQQRTFDSSHDQGGGIPVSASNFTTAECEDAQCHTTFTKHASPRTMPLHHVSVDNSFDEHRYSDNSALVTVSASSTVGDANGMSVTFDQPRQVFMQPSPFFNMHQQPPLIYINENVRRTEQVELLSFASHSYQHGDLA